MLTEEQKQKYAEKYGLTKQSPISGKNRADEFMSLVGGTAKITQQEEDAVKYEKGRDVVSRLGLAGTGRTEFKTSLEMSQIADNFITQAQKETNPIRKQKLLKLANDILRQGEQISGQGEEKLDVKTGIIARGAKAQESIEEGLLKAPLRVAGAGGGLFQDILGAGFQTLGALPGVKVGIEKLKELSLAKEEAGTAPVELENQAKQIATAIITKWSQFEEENPEVAQDLRDTTNIALTMLDFAMFSAGRKATQEGVRNLAKQGDEVLSNMVKAGEKYKLAGEKITSIGMVSKEGTRIAIQTYEASKPTFWQRIKNMVAEEYGIGKKVATEVGKKPITEAETVARLLTPGTEKGLGISARRTSNRLWTEIVEPALDSSKNRTNMKQFVNEIRNEIIANNPVGKRRDTLLKSWKAWAEPYKKVTNISDKRLQLYKEDWAKFLPEAAYKGEPIASTLKEVQDIAAKKARQKLYDSLGPDVKQAYLDYGNLQVIMEEAIKGTKPADQLSAFRKAWELLIDRAVTPITSFSGKVLYKTGEGLEFIGEKGAKTVRDIFGISATKK